MTPDDVYKAMMARHDALTGLIVLATLAVCLMIAAQIAVKVVVFGRFWKQLKRLDGLLKLAELHGELTDAQAARMRLIAQDEFKYLMAVDRKVEDVRTIATSTQKDVLAVKSVVEETAPAVRAVMAEQPSGSGKIEGWPPVDPANPPRRRAEDKIS